MSFNDRTETVEAGWVPFKECFSEMFVAPIYGQKKKKINICNLKLPLFSVFT